MKKISTPLAISIIVVLTVIVVVGVLVYRHYSVSQRPSMSTVVKTSTAITPTITSKGETANWKTYTNTNLGISFKYPDDTTIKEENNSIQINNWKIEVYKNGNKKSLEEWFKSVFDKAKNSDCLFMGSNIKVGSYQTYLISVGSVEENCTNGGYYAISDTKSLIVNLEFGQDTFKPENIAPIFSTFKFLY